MKLDCKKCGACCLAAPWSPPGQLVPFADVEDDEAEKIHEKHPSWVVLCKPSGFGFREPTFAMAISKKDPRGRCLALAGTVGRRTSCSIYEDRPSGCRDFEPGSERCLEIRRDVLGANA